jgi:hypothetical protein
MQAVQPRARAKSWRQISLLLPFTVLLVLSALDHYCANTLSFWTKRRTVVSNAVLA